MTPERREAILTHSMSTEPAALVERCRPTAPRPADALRVLIDWWHERGDPAGQTYQRALDEPDLAFLGVETFRCPNDVEGEKRYDVAVFRFEPFARAIGLAPYERAIDTEFVLLPPGGRSARALIGSPPDEPGRGDDEDRRTVVLEPFLIARTAVTLRVCEGAGGRHEDLERRALRPVGMEFDQAARLCWRNGLRFPSEVEWEYACRAGTSTAFYFGSALTTAWVQYMEDHDDPDHIRGYGTVEVGSLPGNAFGLHEMLGNVSEWCSDEPAEMHRRQHAAEYRAHRRTSGASGPSGRTFVCRGGHWYQEPLSRYRAASRVEGDRHHGYGGLGFLPGFRPALSLPAPRRVAPVRRVSGSGTPSALIESCRPIVRRWIDRTGALRDLIDRWIERGDLAGFSFRRALDDPELAFLGIELFRCANPTDGDTSFDVAVFRFEPFARAIGIGSGKRELDTEFVLLPPDGRTAHLPLGSPPEGRDRGCTEDERGTDIEPFLVARTVVSQRVFMNALSRRRVLPGFDPTSRLPAELEWEESMTVCGRVGLRLPSEAEWRYASHGGAATTRCVEQVPRVPHPAGSLSPVGLGRPNAYGLCDAPGAVAEWRSEDGSPPSVTQRRAPVRPARRGGRSLRPARSLRT